MNTALLMSIVLLLAGPAAAGEDPLKDLLKQEEKILAQAEKEDSPGLRKQLADLRADIALAQWDAGDVGQAEAYLEYSLYIDPQRADRWAMLGDILQFTGQPGALLLAQSAYEKALEIDPKRDWVRERLAAAYMQSGRFLKAVEQFEIVLKNQEKPDSRNAVAMAAAYATSDEDLRGSRLFQEAYRKGSDPRFLVAAAVLNRHAGDLKGAFSLLRQAQSESKDKDLSDYALDLRRQYGDPEVSR